MYGFYDLMDKISMLNLHINAHRDDGRTFGEHQLSFLLQQPQDTPNAVGVC